MQNSCSHDIDCPSLEGCYINVTWRENGCDCSTFYGFKRNPSTLECTDLDQTALFYIVSSIIFMIISGILFIISVVDSLRIFISRNLHGVLATTCLFTALSLLFCFLDFLFLFLNSWVAIYSPVGYSDKTNTLSDKAAAYTPQERASVIFAGLFGIFASLNIPLYWLEVVERSKRLNQRDLGNISKFKWPLGIFQVLLLLLAIVGGLVLGYFSVVSLVMIPVLFGIGFAYLYSITKMENLLDHSIKSSDTPADQKRMKIIQDFRISAKIILVGLLVAAIAFATYGGLSLVYTWQLLCEEGSVCSLAIFVCLVRVGFVIGNFGLLTYLHKRVKVITRKDRIKSSREQGSKEQGSVISPSQLTTVDMKSMKTPHGQASVSVESPRYSQKVQGSP